MGKPITGLVNVYVLEIEIDTKGCKGTDMTIFTSTNSIEANKFSHNHCSNLDNFKYSIHKIFSNVKGENNKILYEN